MSSPKITIDTAEISASVYHKTEKSVYYVKVSIPSLYLYINSITVRPSTKYPDKGLWIQMPAFKVGNRWIRPLEFRNDSILKNLIEDEVSRAVDAYNEESILPDTAGLDYQVKNIKPP